MFIFVIEYGRPTGLWRDVIKSDLLPQDNGLHDTRIMEGDRIFVDFTKTYMSVRDLFLILHRVY
jgi:hypothetical protein